MLCVRLSTVHMLIYVTEVSRACTPMLTFVHVGVLARRLFTCRYSPMKQIENMPPALEYDPVRCKQPKCGAVLNPYW